MRRRQKTSVLHWRAVNGSSQNRWWTSKITRFYIFFTILTPLSIKPYNIFFNSTFSLHDLLSSFNQEVLSNATPWIFVVDSIFFWQSIPGPSFAPTFFSLHCPNNKKLYSLYYSFPCWNLHYI